MTIVGLRCPACGAPATGFFITGDWHLCRGCGAWSAVAGSGVSQVLVQKTQPDVPLVERRRQVRDVVRKEQA